MILRQPPQLFYTDSGTAEAPALVFLHGFPFNHTMWNAQAELCKPHFRVITYDHRGQGQSEAGNGQYFFEFYVDDFFRLLDALGIAKAIVCGLSMGGYAALRAAERHPERIAGLVLCDTRSEADADATKLKRAADFRFIQDQGLEAFAEKFLKAALSPSSFLKRPTVVEDVRRMIVTTPVIGACGALLAIATRTDTTPFLPRIQVPTLILVGADDAITPPALAQAMHERIAGSEMAVIPEAGHLSAMDNPTAFNNRLMDFLKRFTPPKV